MSGERTETRHETRFHEGVGINKSLSALNHVLRQMGDS